MPSHSSEQPLSEHSGHSIRFDEAENRILEKYQGRLLLILMGAFFISGFSALLYQVVWQRMLGLFSGSDVRSVTIVTTAFLAGLGFGSFSGSMIADRLSSRRAIQIFGLCNLGIAAFAFLSRLIYYDLLFKQNPFQTLVESPVLMLIIVLLSLLIPTTLMGISLPLVSRAIVRETGSAAARRIGLLYGMNTLGAGTGTVISGWYILGTLGYEQSTYLGGILSLGVALIALFLVAPYFSTESLSVQEKKKSSGFSLQDYVQQVPRHVWVWCGMVFISGFMAISLEIIWFRVLDVTLKSNAYTFAHLLAFFLVADAAGSLVAVRVVHRFDNPRRLFFWVQGLVAVYSPVIILLISIAARHFPLADYIAEASGRLEWKWTDMKVTWFVYFALPGVMILPPAFLIGFYIPVVHRAVQTDEQAVGQRVGLIELSNVIGNSAGSIVTGFILLNYPGTSGSLRIIGFLGLILVGFLIYENYDVLSQRIAGGLLAGALILMLIIFPNNHTLWKRLHGAEQDKLFIVAEDNSGVAALRKQKNHTLLFANGRLQGELPFTEVHGLLGALPALVHPDPEQIMVIGIGSFATPYAVGVNSETDTIKAVEIIGSELDALEAFIPYDDTQVIATVMADERYEIIIGDGRRELVLSDIKFDIIEADAIRPTSSHSGLLYSREFFEEAREQLAEGGIMAQWMPTYRVEATFVSVFPYVVKVGDLILLGSKEPIPYDEALILEKLDSPDIRSYLEAAQFDIAAMRGWIERGAVFLTPDSPKHYPDSSINTDLFPRDEYYLNN